MKTNLSKALGECKSINTTPIDGGIIIRLVSLRLCLFLGELVALSKKATQVLTGRNKKIVVKIFSENLCTAQQNAKKEFEIVVKKIVPNKSESKKIIDAFLL